MLPMCVDYMCVCMYWFSHCTNELQLHYLHTFTSTKHPLVSPAILVPRPLSL